MYDVFALPPVSFPAGFLWGSATAGHQIEGGNVHSDWWAMEHGTQPRFPGLRIDEPSGRACDSWRRWREDVELLATLGHRAYRLSLEWSRLEPEPGVHDEAALATYVAQLEALVARGIQPWVTLHHFVHPLWFERLGAFREAANAERFLGHVEWLVPRIAHLVSGWFVFNEFNLGRKPGDASTKTTLIRTHARAYHAIKAHSSAPVSTAHAHVHWFPRRLDDPFDLALTRWLDWATHGFWFHAIRTGEIIQPDQDMIVDPQVKGTCDLWAVNYYTRHMVDARSASHEGPRFAHKRLRLIDRDFYLEEFFPEGLVANLERIRDKPVIISENGCSCDDDRWRIAYLALHLSAVHEAIQRGVDVRGFLYWSLLDNWEWGSFVPRFGLVDVDRTTFRRTPKPSAAFYREIIAANALRPEMVARHLDHLPTQRGSGTSCPGSVPG